MRIIGGKNKGKKIDFLQVIESKFILLENLFLILLRQKTLKLLDFASIVVIFLPL